MKKTALVLLAMAIILTFVTSPTMAAKKEAKTVEKPVKVTISASYYEQDDGTVDVTITAITPRKGKVGTASMSMNGTPVEGGVGTKVVKIGSGKYYQTVYKYTNPSGTAELEFEYDITMKNGNTVYTGADKASVTLGKSSSGSRMNLRRQKSEATVEDPTPTAYTVAIQKIDVDRTEGARSDAFTFKANTSITIPQDGIKVKHRWFINGAEVVSGAESKTTATGFESQITLVPQDIKPLQSSYAVSYDIEIIDNNGEAYVAKSETVSVSVSEQENKDISGNVTVKIESPSKGVVAPGKAITFTATLPDIGGVDAATWTLTDPNGKQYTQIAAVIAGSSKGTLTSTLPYEPSTNAKAGTWKVKISVSKTVDEGIVKTTYAGSGEISFRVSKRAK